MKAFIGQSLSGRTPGAGGWVSEETKVVCMV